MAQISNEHQTTAFVRLRKAVIFRTSMEHDDNNDDDDDDDVEYHSCIAKHKNGEHFLFIITTCRVFKRLSSIQTRLMYVPLYIYTVSCFFNR